MKNGFQSDCPQAKDVQSLYLLIWNSKLWHLYIRKFHTDIAKLF